MQADFQSMRQGRSFTKDTLLGNRRGTAILAESCNGNNQNKDNKGSYTQLHGVTHTWILSTAWPPLPSLTAAIAQPL